MNETNSMNLLAVQQIAAAAGYHLSGGEITLLIALGGGVVHVLHQIVANGGLWPTWKMIWDNTNKPMKNNLLIGIAALGLAMMTMTARATEFTNTVIDANGNTTTTISTNPPPGTISPGVFGSGVGKDVAAAGVDLWGNIKLAMPFTTNGNATARFAGGLNTSTKQTVLAMVVTVPVSQTVAIGAVVAHAGSQWYEGGANITLGITNNWPVIGVVRSGVGDGVVYDFGTRAPANYAYTFFQKDWVLSSRWAVGAEVIAANTSDRSGVDVLVGAHVTYWWGKLTSGAAD